MKKNARNLLLQQFPQGGLHLLGTRLKQFDGKILFGGGVQSSADDSLRKFQIGVSADNHRNDIVPPGHDCTRQFIAAVTEFLRRCHDPVTCLLRNAYLFLASVQHQRNNGTADSAGLCNIAHRDHFTVSLFDIFLNLTRVRYLYYMQK